MEVQGLGSIGFIGFRVARVVKVSALERRLFQQWSPCIVVAGAWMKLILSR